MLVAAVIISLSACNVFWAAAFAGNVHSREAEEEHCGNTISPYLINVSHSQIELLWKKAHRTSVYCLCRGSVSRAGFTADFEGCDGGARWLCRESGASPAAISASELEPATEYVFCARRRCAAGGYSRDAECARVRSAQREGWKFTVDLMEPQRALVLWTLPDRGEDEPQHYEVTWCCWVGGLSACQNKSSGTDGVVITHLGAWLIYDVAVGTRSALLFKARFRTRPDSAADKSKTPTEQWPSLTQTADVKVSENNDLGTTPNDTDGDKPADMDTSEASTSSLSAKRAHEDADEHPVSRCFCTWTEWVGGKALLSWTAPKAPRGPLQAYDVSWCTTTSCEALETAGKTRHVLLDDVRPSTNYTFRVRAKNVLEDTPLEGPHAEAIVFTPPKGLIFQLVVSMWTAHCLAEGIQAGSCEKFFVHDSRKVIANGQPWTMASVEVTDPSDALLFYTVYRSPPGRPSAPLEVQVSPLNSSALELRWSPPELGRGPVDGYLVKWHTFYGDGESLRLGSRDLRSLVIADVEELNTYTVQVAAYNLWSGSFLAGEEAVTYGISYSSGMNVNVSSGLTWAVLTWTLRHELIEEVLLTCCEPEQLDACPHEVLLNSSARRHRLQGLEPWRAYDLRFFRYEGMALVLRKRFRTGKPVEAVPSLSPPDVSYTFLDDGSVLVSWTPSPGCAPAAAPTSNVSSGSDDGEGFLVSWAPVLQQDSSGATGVREEITADTHLTLRSLTPSTSYVVEVHALATCGADDAPRVWALRIDTPPATSTTVVAANTTQ
ncbi:hypothetical protein MTO96_012090 [Rhipicephalus appendiculatus]